MLYPARAEEVVNMVIQGILLLRGRFHGGSAKRQLGSHRSGLCPCARLSRVKRNVVFGRDVFFPIYNTMKVAKKYWDDAMPIEALCQTLGDKKGREIVIIWCVEGTFYQILLGVEKSKWIKNTWLFSEKIKKDPIERTQVERENSPSL